MKINKWFVAVSVVIISGAAWAGHHEGPGRHGEGGFFAMMDTDNDGKISEAEHEAALNKMLERRRAHFKEMDADGNGVVDKAEAASAREEMHEKMRDRRAAWKKDCDGKSSD